MILICFFTIFNNAIIWMVLNHWMFPLLICGRLLFCLNDSVYTQFSSILLSMLSAVSMIFYNLLTRLIMSFSTISTFFHTSHGVIQIFLYFILIIFFLCLLYYVYIPHFTLKLNQFLNCTSNQNNFFIYKWYKAKK